MDPISSLNTAANQIEDFSNKVKNLSDRFKQVAQAHHKLVNTQSGMHYGEVKLYFQPSGGVQIYTVTDAVVLEKIKELVVQDMVKVMTVSRDQLEKLIKEAVI